MLSFLVVVVDASHECDVKDQDHEEMLVTVEVTHLLNDKKDPVNDDFNAVRWLAARLPEVSLSLPRDGHFSHTKPQLSLVTASSAILLHPGRPRLR